MARVVFFDVFWSKIGAKGRDLGKLRIYLIMMKKTCKKTVFFACFLASIFGFPGRQMAAAPRGPLFAAGSPPDLGTRQRLSRKDEKLHEKAGCSPCMKKHEKTFLPYMNYMGTRYS